MEKDINTLHLALFYARGWEKFVNWLNWWPSYTLQINDQADKLQIKTFSWLVSSEITRFDSTSFLQRDLKPHWTMNCSPSNNRLEFHSIDFSEHNYYCTHFYKRIIIPWFLYNDSTSSLQRKLKPYWTMNCYKVLVTLAT